MLLTETRKDALAELINIAFGRTGAALSELTGNRVLLAPPEVAVHPTSELRPVISQFVPGEAAWIHQEFSGTIGGDALLLLSYDSAVHLTNLLGDTQTPLTRLDGSAREALTEVGNILLNACLGMFGNLLRVRVSFSVPQIHVESVDDLVRSLSHSGDDARYALIIFTAFRVKDAEVKGYLVLVLSIQSLDKLIDEIDIWETRSH
jgi:chemotaxis protein CheC